MIVSVKHNLRIYELLLDWQHVSTLRGHHQTFIMNQLILESCLHSWDPKQCLQNRNMNGSYYSSASEYTTSKLRIIWCYVNF
jgi:hypothetical protein